MRTRLAMLLTAAGGGMLLTTACSFLVCPVGVTPFDGATGVTLDTEITFFMDAALEDDLPSLRDGIRLTDLTDGRDVAFDADIDLATGLVVVQPRGGLQPEHDYEVRGIVESAVRAAEPHWHGRLPWDSETSRFTTASAPVALDAFVLDSATTVLVFSEPMDLDTLDVLAEGTEGPVPVTVIGRFEGEARMVELLVPAEVGAHVPNTLYVGREARSLAGTALQSATTVGTSTATAAPDDDLVTAELGPDAIAVGARSRDHDFDRYRGLPRCEG